MNSLFFAMKVYCNVQRWTADFNVSRGATTSTSTFHYLKIYLAYQCSIIIMIQFHHKNNKLNPRPQISTSNGPRYCTWKASWKTKQMKSHWMNETTVVETTTVVGCFLEGGCVDAFGLDRHRRWKQNGGYINHTTLDFARPLENRLMRHLNGSTQILGFSLYNCAMFVKWWIQIGLHWTTVRIGSYHPIQMV